MVSATAIVESNCAYAHQKHSGLVCVFAGATAGIGRATLERLATMLQASTFYVIGRDKQRHAPWLDQLGASSHNRFLYVEGQVSLISDIDRACDQIRSTEHKVDILCMSPGGMPFAGARYTEEGLETCFAVSYYSRLRLIWSLLPLLRSAHRPARVLSILNGSKENKVNEEDLNLETQWGIRPVVNHTTLLTSLSFDYLAAQAPQGRTGVVFLHATPGFVNTNTPRTKEYLPSRDKVGLMQWALISVIQVVSGWVIRYFGMNIKESGERHAFHLTSEMFEAGSWRIDRHSNIVADNHVLKDYKSRGWAEKAWNFTVGIWDKALARTDTSR